MTRVIVPISGASADAVCAQARAARDARADLVELRMDTAITAGASAAALLEALPGLALPAAVTIRHADEGGSWSGPESERLALYAEADRRGAAHVDIELARWDGAWRPARAGLILSHHDFTGMGPGHEGLSALVARMHAAGAMAKIAVTARDAADLDVIRRLCLAGAGVAGGIVAVAMGEHGLASRLLAGAWGCELAFARLEGNTGSAPGQPTVRDLLDLYHLRAQGKETRVFGVIGSPVAHSLSPLIHNAALRASALDAVYVPFRVEDPVSFWRACGAWIEGLSITLPHKQALLGEMHELEELSASIKAMNTIYRGEAGEGGDGIGNAIGGNTDANAIVRCLEIAVGRLEGRKVLVLGAGGVARTAAFACKAKGAIITVANRTEGRGRDLAAEVGCEAVALERAGGCAYDVLVNGTSVGMGKPNESPWPAAWHRSGTVVFDTVYTPLETRLLREAVAAGAITVCGLDMFISQAVGQFCRWTGGEAPEHLMYRLALERLS